MRRVAQAAGLGCVLGMLGCGAGIETMGTERRPDRRAEAETASASEAGAATGTATETATGTETETATATATATETETATATATATATETDTGTASAPRTGTAPEAAAQGERFHAAPRVVVTVRSTTGPISRSIARHVVGRQFLQIQYCYELALSTHPGIAGSIRAVLRVEASGSASADLETLTPELDVVLPCVDAALERSTFPVTGASAGGAERSHVFVEVALGPR